MSSVTARVFNGCRALLAPARSSSSSAAAAAATATKPTTATKTTPKPKPKPKAKAKPKSPSTPSPSRAAGIMKPCTVTLALGEFLEASESSRSEAVKKVWDYIKANNLQNPADKRQIFCDDKLKTIFDGKDKVGFLEIGKLLSVHFVKIDD